MGANTNRVGIKQSWCPLLLWPATATGRVAMSSLATRSLLVHFMKYTDYNSSPIILYLHMAPPRQNTSAKHISISLGPHPSVSPTEA